MTKFGLAALAVVAALVMSFGVRSSTPTAHAEVDSTVSIWCGFLAGLDVNGDDALTAADGIAACTAGLDAAEIVNITEAQSVVVGDPEGLGDEDGVLEAGELDDLDLDANQITVTGNGSLSTILIIAFVDDDGVVTFDAPTGQGAVVAISPDGTAPAETPADDGNVETCEGDDDQDCGASVINGDGVVVATVSTDANASAGEDIDVNVEQETVGPTETLTVVGAGDNIALTLVESTIQSGAAASCDAGTDPEITDDDALGNPDSTVAIVVITDNDDTALTRQSVTISSDDTDVATIGDTTSITVDAGANGTAFFAVICGGDTGTANIDVTGAGEDDTAEITVVGEAANITLAAAPAQIACDGTQTSTVTATVTDADGNNVADGTTVTFSVVALGTANPINVDTVGGAASSTITPLSGATAGVTVVVSSGDASASIRVDCSLPIPTPTSAGAAPTATPPGGVRPPDTGNGGYLGQDTAAGFPMWTLVALALGSFALVAGGMVTRRAGK